MTAVVQHTSKIWATAPQTIALTGVTSGNTLLCFTLTNVGDTDAVSDTLSLTWAKATERSGGGGPSRVAVWWAHITSSGTSTVTVNSTPGGSNGLWLYEISGLATSPVDGTPVGASSSTNAPCTAPNLTGLASTTDFVVYHGGYQGAGSTATGGIWTNDYSVTISGGVYSGLAYAITGTSVTAPVINPPNVGNFECYGVAFAPGGSTVTGTATLSLGPITLTATGTVIPSGSGTASLPLGPVTVTVIAAATGTSSLPLGPITLAATGTPLPTVTGTAAVLVGPVTLNANVYHTYISLGPITLTVATSLFGGGGLATLVESVPT